MIDLYRLRPLRLIMLGRMAERVLTSDEPVYLKHGPVYRGVSLRVDGEWPLTPHQARVVRRVMKGGTS